MVTEEMSQNTGTNTSNLSADLTFYCAPAISFFNWMSSNAVHGSAVSSMKFKEKIFKFSY